MDASRFIGLAFLFLSLVVLSYQIASESTDTPPPGFICPLMDFPKIVNGTLKHNVTRTLKCVNGREMAGCCVTRFFCDFNSSNIDFTLYGPPEYRMSCSDVCCPQNYILPIPLPNLNKTDTAKESKDKKTTRRIRKDDSMNASSNSLDSDSDENE